MPKSKPDGNGSSNGVNAPSTRAPTAAVPPEANPAGATAPLVESPTIAQPQAPSDAAELMQQMTAMFATLTRQLAAAQSPIAPAPVTLPRPRLTMELPTYSGYADERSVHDFLLRLDTYQTAVGASDDTVIRQILPIALVGDAARWWRLQEPPSSMAAFHERFRSEFLPPDYERRVREELNTRTQHPDESLLEYVRAIQELYSRADPAASHADQVSRVIRQCHPSFQPYLRGRSFDTVEALAREARVVQADLLAELRYAPPPRPEESLEPGCAFAGSQSPTPRVEAASVSAVVRREAREVVSARALDPFSYEQRRRAGRENRPSSSVGAIAAGARGVPRRGDNASRFGRDERDGRRQSPGRRPLRCFRCDQPGHIIRNCPQLERDGQRQGNARGQRR